VCVNDGARVKDGECRALKEQPGALREFKQKKPSVYQKKKTQALSGLGVEIPRSKSRKAFIGRPRNLRLESRTKMALGNEKKTKVSTALKR